MAIWQNLGRWFSVFGLFFPAKNIFGFCLDAVKSIDGWFDEETCVGIGGVGVLSAVDSGRV
jgi:hypothetical protein